MGLWAATRRLAICVAIAGAAVSSSAIVGTNGQAEAQVSTSFSRIDVAGNRRIEAATIRSIANIPTGVAVSPATLNGALQALFDSGLFQDVELSPSAGLLTIKVVENPTINQIAFEGNGSLDDSTLASLIDLRPRLAYSRSAAEADALRIVEAYRAAGRFSAEVLPFIIQREDNRVDLVFEVNEGGVTEVQRIAFVGNRAYSDSRLRRAIETGEAGVLRVFFSNDTYDRDRIQLDQQLLREFYLDRGYVDFRIRSVVTELSRDRDGFLVSFNVSEGPQYSFGQVSLVSSVPSVDPAPYQRLINVREGTTYSASKVERIIENMSEAMYRDGTVFVDVEPRVTKNEAARTIDLTFDVVPGRRSFVERIDIEGNTRTLDRVIRRQFRIVEGDPLNPREVRRAENRIRGLGVFSNVRVSAREGSAPDQVVIDVDVEEDRTGSLSFGVGYSTDSGICGTISFSERNFAGRGQRVQAEASYADRSRILSFSFTEPGLLDRDILAGFNLYYREVDRDESSFQETNIGFEPQLGFPVSEDGRLTVGYRISSDEIRDVDPAASALIQPRKDLTSAVVLTYRLDKRNSPVDPSSGFTLRLEQEFAGLGGDVTFSKTSGAVKGYASVLSEDVILSAEFEGGMLNSDGESRITDRFFLGGNSLRGFELGGIGPRDFCTGCGTGGADVNDALGGNVFAVGRLEASFPLGLPDDLGIFGGVFYDVGSVWELDNVAGSGGAVDDSFQIRSAAGVSVFWSTPIGPLRFNWAWPIEKQSYDRTENFRISLDTRF